LGWSSREIGSIIKRHLETADIQFAAEQLDKSVTDLLRKLEGKKGEIVLKLLKEKIKQLKKDGVETLVMLNELNKVVSGMIKLLDKRRI